MSDIHEKLRKLLALAQQGIGGEKTNAQARLEALMQKHGIQLSELEDEAKKTQWFKPARGSIERRLLFQVISQVCGNTSTWKNKSKPGRIGVEVTKSQHLEIDLRYSAYLIALQKQMDITFSAFIHTNQIFPDGPASDAPSKLSDTELKQIAIAMLGMSKVKIHRTLTHKDA